MTTRAAAPQEATVLRVDATAHAAEVARFTRFVVRGPGPRDCWLWVGAIADDGYGRFWLNRHGHKRVVRPHRYALALTRGLSLGELDIVMHEVCDLPLCVRAEAVGGHLEVGTQAQNLAQMGRAGRGGGRGWPHRWYGLDRAQRAARSRALRDAVRDGWDPAAVRKASPSASNGSSSPPTLRPTATQRRSEWPRAAGAASSASV